jgi:hypothetical protein
MVHHVQVFHVRLVGRLHRAVRLRVDLQHLVLRGGLQARGRLLRVLYPAFDGALRLRLYICISVVSRK